MHLLHEGTYCTNEPKYLLWSLQTFTFMGASCIAVPRAGMKWSYLLVTKLSWKLQLIYNYRKVKILSSEGRNWLPSPPYIYNETYFFRQKIQHSTVAQSLSSRLIWVGGYFLTSGTLTGGYRWIQVDKPVRLNTLYRILCSVIFGATLTTKNIWAQKYKQRFLIMISSGNFCS